MLFSVVIPTFNRRLLLREALDSVWAQSHTDYEVIVVDNGSTDGTREVLALAGDRLTAVLQAEPGPGGARNAGISKARGDYIAFLDSDDRWFPWTLATIAHFIRAGASPAMLAGRIHQFRDPSELNAVVEEAPQAITYADFLESASSPLLIGSGSLIVRRDVAQASGGFTTLHINGEDSDWMLRLGTAAGFVRVSAPATLAWRRHDASAMANLSLSIAGARYLIEQERAGHYPGGDDRARDRRVFIGRQVRSVSFSCVNAGEIRNGCELYSATFAWHFALLRLRYLIGFPLAALARALWPARRHA